MQTQQKSTTKDMFLRTIAVVGLVAVLLLGAWGIIQLAVAIPGFFNNIGGKVATSLPSTSQTESMSVSAPATVTAGQSFIISWTHANQNSGDYSYAISYACQNGLSIKAPLPNGSYQTVSCNTAFNFVKATAHMTLIPTFTGTASAPVSFTVTATRLSTGTITASGSTNTTIAGAGGSSATATATKGVTKGATPVQKGVTTAVVKGTADVSYYTAPTTAQVYGYPDLAVRIVSIVPQVGGLMAARFEITNIGTNVTPANWTFTASLPMNGTYPYASGPQQALAPGAKIVYTLTFTPNNTYGYNYDGYQNYPYNSDSLYGYGISNNNGYTCNGYTCSYANNGYPQQYPNYNYGYQSGVVTVTVDPYNQIFELNKANNTASMGVPVGY